MGAFQRQGTSGHRVTSRPAVVSAKNLSVVVVPIAVGTQVHCEVPVSGVGEQ